MLVQGRGAAKRGAVIVLWHRLLSAVKAFLRIVRFGDESMEKSFGFGVRNQIVENYIAGSGIEIGALHAPVAVSRRCSG